jgi:hypothetical protein
MVLSVSPTHKPSPPPSLPRLCVKSKGEAPKVGGEGTEERWRPPKALDTVLKKNRVRVCTTTPCPKDSALTPPPSTRAHRSFVLLHDVPLLFWRLGEGAGLAVLADVGFLAPLGVLHHPLPLLEVVDVRRHVLLPAVFRTTAGKRRWRGRCVGGCTRVCERRRGRSRGGGMGGRRTRRKKRACGGEAKSRTHAHGRELTRELTRARPQPAARVKQRT